MLNILLSSDEVLRYMRTERLKDIDLTTISLYLSGTRICLTAFCVCFILYIFLVFCNVKNAVFTEKYVTYDKIIKIKLIFLHHKGEIVARANLIDYLLF